MSGIKQNLPIVHYETNRSVEPDPNEIRILQEKLEMQRLAYRISNLSEYLATNKKILLS